MDRILRIVCIVFANLIHCTSMYFRLRYFTSSPCRSVCLLLKVDLILTLFMLFFAIFCFNCIFFILYSICPISISASIKTYHQQQFIFSTKL
uniref:Putative product n=1 Tax=Xenopsylla cheopis TaxID=163159 RepID=A0A6M2DYX9_XENCH